MELFFYKNLEIKMRIKVVEYLTITITVVAVYSERRLLQKFQSNSTLTETSTPQSSPIITSDERTTLWNR
jgi:hypothetical protein